MSEVSLVLMPFAAPQRPSIALGMLKASLTARSISCQVHYANLWYVEAMSLGAIMQVERNPVECLVGEWVFSQAAFPDFESDAAAFHLLNPRAATLPDYLPVVTRLRELAPGFIDQTARRLLADKPRIVGCSSMFQQHCASLALLRRIKELDPNVVTMLGGANCEASMGETTHRLCPWVDYVVNGEAELVFPELCAQLLDQGFSRGLPGVWTPDDRDHPRDLERLVVDRLDQSPTPDYDDYFQALEQSNLRQWISPGLLIETSRGCWWGQKHHCTFCGLNGSGMGYRSKSAERILQEFEELSQRYHTRNFEVVDNIINMAHLETVLPTLAQARPKYNLFYETKSNLRYEQMVRLAEAGVHWIQPGIESLHDQILKLMDKGTTALINVQLLKWARELGIQVNWNLLFAFPGEDPEWYAEMAAWMPLVFHLQPPSGGSPVRYDRFSPYHTHPERWGIGLTPCVTYAHVYPFGADELNRLAYFFEDSPDSIRRLKRFALEGTHELVRQQLSAWMKAYGQSLRPVLTMDDDGEEVTILDTRPCARARRHHLRGLEREVLLACEQGRSRQSLAALGEVESALEHLCQAGLLLRLGDKYLGLAVKGSLPSNDKGYPGGDLLSIPAPRLPEVVA